MILYDAFGWEQPKLCHLPMVMGKDGHKLSKRHGASTVREFRKLGYLPEALLNYIALVGWSYDDAREFFTLEELEKLFTMEKINKSPAVFDYQKLDWFNGSYLRKMTAQEFAGAIKPRCRRRAAVGHRRGQRAGGNRTAHPGAGEASHGGPRHGAVHLRGAGAARRRKICSRRRRSRGPGACRAEASPGRSSRAGRDGRERGGRSAPWRRSWA